MKDKPFIGQRVIYKFDRKIVGGTTEQRVGRAKDAIKVEGVEIEAFAVITKVHEDGSVDLEVLSRPGAGAPYSFRSVTNGIGEGQWRAPAPPIPPPSEAPRAAETQTAGNEQ